MDDLTQKILNRVPSTYDSHTPEDPKLPAAWRPTRVDNGDGTGEVVSHHAEACEDHAALLRRDGLDPEAVRIVGPVRRSSWQQKPDVWLEAVRYHWEATRQADPEKRAQVDEWLNQAMGSPAFPLGMPSESYDPYSAFFFSIADLQAGKADGDGTEGMVNRFHMAVNAAVKRVNELRDRRYRLDLLVIPVLGDLLENCSGHYCVSADTRVLTDDMQWIQAGDLSVGQGLYGLSEDSDSTRGHRFAQSRVISHEVKSLPTVTVTLENGQRLVSTPEHPWLTVRASGGSKGNVYKWVEAKDLDAGDHQILKPLDVWDTDTTRDGGWLAGIYDGEGSLSSGSTRAGPNILGVSQNPGPVLDKMKAELAGRGFNYAESASATSKVHNLRIRGGYSEVLRALGTLRPERLINKIGYPYMRLGPERKILVTSVEHTSQQPVAVMGTSSRTFIAEGYAAHNSMQTFTVELTNREQRILVRNLILYALEKLAPLFEAVSVVAVGGNHGERRNEQNKAFTDFSDNDDVAVVEDIAHFAEWIPYCGNVTFHLPQDELHITLDIVGVPVTFAHGHQFAKGRAVKDLDSKAESWLARMAHTEQEAGYGRLLLSGHYHSLKLVDFGPKIWLQHPSPDGGSVWYQNTGGGRAKPGFVSFVLFHGDNYPHELELL